MAEEKKMPLIAVLRNQSEEKVVFKWDGFPYIWNPGEPMKVPVEIAGHFIGEDKVGRLEDTSPNGLAREKERVLDLIPKDKRDGPHPLILVEIIDPNIEMAAKKTEFVSEPVPERAEGEKPFASLDSEEKPKEEPDLVAEAIIKRKPGRPSKVKEPVK